MYALIQFIVAASYFVVYFFLYSTGIKGNSIVGIGKAGNPDTMNGITDPNMVVGVTTEVIAGENMIVTAGGVDTHVHWICPQLIEEAVASGITTLYGGGTGPAVSAPRVHFIW